MKRTAMSLLGVLTFWGNLSAQSVALDVASKTIGEPERIPHVSSPFAVPETHIADLSAIGLTERSMSGGGQYWASAEFLS